MVPVTQTPGPTVVGPGASVTLTPGAASASRLATGIPIERGEPVRRLKRSRTAEGCMKTRRGRPPRAATTAGSPPVWS